jgi:hypothetical protein
MLSMKQGKRNPSEWAHYAWEIISAQGQKILKNGQTLQSSEDNIDELTTQAKEFELKRLPMLRALQVV